MVQVEHDASDNASVHCSCPCVSEAFGPRAPPAPGRQWMQLEVSGSRRVVGLVRQQTKSNTLGTMRKVPNFPTVSDVARKKKSKNQPQGCCPSCGRHARDKCFCKEPSGTSDSCILSAGGKGKKSLMCENEVSIRRGRSRYDDDDEDRRQQQRRAGADNA